MSKAHGWGWRRGKKPGKWGMSSHLEDAEAELSTAEAEVSRLRAENQILANDFRMDPSDDGKEGLRRAAASLAVARDRVDAARARLTLAQRTGSPYGVISEGGRVFGTIAVTLPPGVSKTERENAIDLALGVRRRSWVWWCRRHRRASCASDRDAMETGRRCSM